MCETIVRGFTKFQAFDIFWLTKVKEILPVAIILSPGERIPPGGRM
jgi:hypothetical protein